MILDKFHLIKNGVDTELEIVDTAGRAALNDLEDSLSPVATSGDYDDLTNKPSLAAVATSGDYDDLTNKPSLAAVATSGDYDDLTNKPSLAAVATSGDYDDLIDKPSLAAVATSGNYNDLTNKPTIPSNTNQLTNGANFIPQVNELQANAVSLSFGFDYGAWKFRMNFSDGTKAEIRLTGSNIEFGTFANGTWTTHWTK